MHRAESGCLYTHIDSQSNETVKFTHRTTSSCIVRVMQYEADDHE